MPISNLIEEAYKMFKLVKILGVMAVLFATVDHASALSFTAAASSEDYTITNLSGFTISGNVAFDNSSNLTVFTTSPNFSLGNGASFSEVITGLTSGDVFHSVLNVTGNGTPTVVAESVSAVPLPAGFPLFAMALIALASLAYFGGRNRSAAGVRSLAA
jgi:hypothetical protein